MKKGNFVPIFHLLWINPLILLVLLQHAFAVQNYHFKVKEAPYTRLCETKKILTVNGKFPGPTLWAHKGDTVYVTVHNKGRYNVTIHWHGIKQERYPWSDGPEYITQCPIRSGEKFRQKVSLLQEEGTVWWHAHSDWSRATIYGAIVVYPKKGATYPFTPPHKQVLILLGEWWKKDVMQVLKSGLRTGGDFNVSDAYTINGQPGDVYPCSKNGTFKLNVEQGRTYLLRMVNAAMNDILFFKVANHNLTVVGADAAYTKPLTGDYVVISPGQTLDVLLRADQSPNRRYYMAARAYSSAVNVSFDNTTTTAILEYKNGDRSSTPILPSLPYYNDTASAFHFLRALRSLASEEHPVYVPKNISHRIVSTVSINTFPCPNPNPNATTCQGPNGTRLAASMNNQSFVSPSIDILEAYYYHIHNVFGTHFPSFPPYQFNYTAQYLPLDLETPRRGTQVKVLPYGAEVEWVFQGTTVVGGLDHPMHLHGYNFYVVGLGFGNFNETTDPLSFNLVDPVSRNTVVVPIKGWAAIRFKANNPGVWFLHCHLARHLTWGMDTVIIVLNGKHENETLLPPPPDMPPCLSDDRREV